MWKKIAIVGGICAAVAGIGTAAVANSGSSNTAGSPTPSSAAKDHAAKDHAAKDRGAKMLSRALHAQWVAKDKDGKFVTHDAIHGTITAVSATSITVQAEDKTSLTFVVNGDTKVRVRANGKGAKGAITQVHSGDKAAVMGTGTTTLTAKGIIDAGK